MKVKRLIATIVFTIACAFGLSTSVYADWTNGVGKSTDANYWRGGFVSSASGALVYLVDPDGYATSYTKSYLFVTPTLNSQLGGTKNFNCVSPRVAGIQKPTTSININNYWGTCYVDGRGYVSREEEVEEWFLADDGSGYSKGYQLVKQYYGKEAAEKYKNKEVAVAIELVSSVRMGYKAFLKGGTATGSEEDTDTRIGYDTDESMLSNEYYKTVLYTILNNRAVHINMEMGLVGSNPLQYDGKGDITFKYGNSNPSMSPEMVNQMLRTLESYIPGYVVDVCNYMDSTSADAMLKKYLRTFISSGRTTANNVLAVEFENLKTGAKEQLLKRFGMTGDDLGKNDFLTAIGAIKTNDSVTELFEDIGKTYKEFAEKNKDAGLIDDKTSLNGESVFHIWSLGYEFIIGTPRNIQQLYIDRNGLYKGAGNMGFGYNVYKTTLEANKNGALGLTGVPADTCYLATSVGFSDGKAGSTVSIEKGNSKGSKGKVGNPDYVACAQYHNGYTWNAGYHNLLATWELQDPVANLNKTANSAEKGGSNPDFLNPHSTLGIVLIFSGMTPNKQKEENQVNPTGYQYLLSQSQLSDKVDLLNDVNGNKHGNNTFEWQIDKISFTCGSGSDVGNYCYTCGGHHGTETVDTSKCKLSEGQCEVCKGFSGTHKNIYGQPVSCTPHSHGCGCWVVKNCTHDSWVDSSYSFSNKIYDIDKKAEDAIAYVHSSRFQWTMTNDASAFEAQVTGDANTMEQWKTQATTNTYKAVIYKGTNKFKIANWKQLTPSHYQIDTDAFKKIEYVDKANEDLKNNTDYIEKIHWQIRGKTEEDNSGDTVDYKEKVEHDQNNEEGSCSNEEEWYSLPKDQDYQCESAANIMNETYYTRGNKEVACDAKDVDFIEENSEYKVDLIKIDKVGDIQFQPYYAMTNQDLQQNGHSAVLAYKDYKITNLCRFSGITWVQKGTNSAKRVSIKNPNLMLESSQWSLDVNANNNHGGGATYKGGHTVLPGGASYRLGTNTSASTMGNDGQIIAYSVTIEPVLGDEAADNLLGYTQVTKTGSATTIPAKTDTTAKTNQLTRHDNNTKDLMSGLRGLYFEQMISGMDTIGDVHVSTFSKVYKGSAISGLNNSRTNTNTDDKYWLIQDVNNGEANGACMEVVRLNGRGNSNWSSSNDDEIIYVKYYSDAYTNKIKAKVYDQLAEVSVSGTYDVATINEDGTFVINDKTGNVWVDMTTKCTGFPEALAKVLEKLRGNDTKNPLCTWQVNGKWYNEAFDGMDFRIITTRLAMGTLSDTSADSRKLPTERTAVIDPALCPSSKGKGDNFTGFNVSYFRSAYNNLKYPNDLKNTPDAGTAYAVAEIEGKKLYMIRLDTMYVSQPFWIPNVTVDDLY